ncbi:MAG TPA: hypothetical protein VF881_19580 [Polyangiaceae bacterium]
MKISLGRAPLLAMTIAPMLLAGAGCADSESSIFIRQAQAPIAGTSSGCQYDPSPSGLFLTAGTLDVAFRLQYTAGLLVGNQLVARGNSSQLRTETARVQLQGTIVSLEDAHGTVVWGPLTVPASGFIDPASGSTPSYGITESVLIGAEFGGGLLTELQGSAGLVRHFTSVAKVFGHTLGGMSVESGEWRFPINVCYRCLISFPPEANDPKVTPQPNCDAPATTGTSIVQPCAVGQDDTVDCRICKQFFPGSSICEPP